MGRIRQKDIKNTADELMEKYGSELSTDFKENREFLKTILKVEGKFLMNRISGYVTHLMKMKKVKG